MQYYYLGDCLVTTRIDHTKGHSIDGKLLLLILLTLRFGQEVEVIAYKTKDVEVLHLPLGMAAAICYLVTYTTIFIQIALEEDKQYIVVVAQGKIILMMWYCMDQAVH